MPSTRMLDSAIATYSYNEVQFAPAAAATDVWQLTGPTGLTGKVRWVEVGGTAAAVRTQTVSLIKRSAANTGGTSAARTIVKADSADVASFSVMTRWTVNPAGLGAAIGTIDSTTFTLTTGATTPVPQDRAVFNYEAFSLKPIVLNGALEFLCVNFTGVNTVVSTDKIDLEIWWTEQ
jgi:hypothetical protein